MKILRIGTFRDGGTIGIETDTENYWIPNRNSKLERGLYKGKGYFQGEFERVTDINEMFELLNHTARMGEIYLDVKRAYSNFNEG